MTAHSIVDAPMRLVIGLTGFSGSGKDTVETLLAARFGAVRVAFADPLKDEIAAAFGVDRQLLDDPHAKNTPTPALALRQCTASAFVARNWGLAILDALSPRTIMTAWGDWRRETDRLYFVALANARIGALRRADDTTPVVVTDVRYHNELQMLQEAYHAPVWRVLRPGLKPAGGHSSEWELAGAHVDAIIVNNGSLEQLEKIASDLYLALRDGRAA